MDKKQIQISKEKYNLPWHPHPFPKVDSIVIGQLTHVDTEGLHFIILDYENKEAFMPLKEISRRKHKSIRSIFKVGDIRSLLVTKVDEKLGYIDLSNKYIEMAKDDMDRLEKQTKLVNLFYDWMIMIHNLHNSGEYNLNIDKTQWKFLMEHTLWKFSIRDIYDDFIEIKKEKKTIQEIFPDIAEFYSDEKIKILLSCIDKHIKYLITYSFRLFLQNWGVQGVLKINSICSCFQKEVSNIDSNFHFINDPPYYMFNGKTTNKEKLFECEHKMRKILGINENRTDCRFNLELKLEEEEA